jgi:hypothetical protein
MKTEDFNNTEQTEKETLETEKTPEKDLEKVNGGGGSPFGATYQRYF